MYDKNFSDAEVQAKKDMLRPGSIQEKFPTKLVKQEEI